MKTLIIYDNSGYIYIQMTGTYRIPEGGINYVEVTTESYEGKKITAINPKTKELILEELPKTLIQQLEDVTTRLSVVEESNNRLTSKVAALDE